MPSRSALVACAFALTALQVPAHTQAPQSRPAGPRFGTSTTAVLVDVVVRDKKGRPVHGLTAEDFEVLEDGVPQKIIACDAVGSAEAVQPVQPVQPAQPAQPVEPAQPAKPAQPVEPATGQTVVALVFDWLSEQPRAEAFKAARTLVDDMKPGDFAGVFVIDHSLRRLVPFTNDTAALSAGFEQALTRPRPGSSRQSGALVNALVNRPEISPTAGAETSGVPTGAQPDAAAPPAPGAANPGAATAAASSSANAQFAAMLQQFDEMDRYADKEMQANAANDALRGLVQMLAPLPGRKTVVLFSEGLSITNATMDRWGRLEDEANRHNVSFYTFDAVGLRVQSQQAAMGRVIRPEDGTSYTRGLYGDTMERRVEALLNGPTQGLAELASSTGGQYISNTNNLTEAFAKVNEDRRSYYMLSYSSTNPVIDGSFRTIAVKVHRQGVTVRARRGYVASPSIERTDRREYEAPAIAALSERPLPSAFPFQLQALATPMPGRPGLVSLVAAVQSNVLTFDEDAVTSRFQGQATVVARLTSRGEVVGDESQHYEFRGDLQHLETTRAGRILFFAAPEVPAGRTDIDWIVRDDQSGRASVVRSTLTVPEPGTLMVGDLFLVARTERAPKGRSADRNPLMWKDLVLYPAFGEPVSKSKSRDVSFALPLVLDPRGPAPKAELRLLVGTTSVATLPFDLGQPQKDGRLMALGRLPLASVPRGAYTLQVTIGSGATASVRDAALTVEP